MKALATVLGHGDARVLLQYVGNGRQVLVVHLLAGDDADALGCFANRQVHAGGRAGHTGGVGARAFGSGPQARAIDVGRRKLDLAVLCG
ncbi:hypothetical protein D9M71_450640 [compost metagenome]